jgi:hypothetical protein
MLQHNSASQTATDRVMLKHNLRFLHPFPLAFERNQTMDMDKDTFRVVTRGADGQIRIRDYDSPEALLKRHCQVGVDDCSTDLGVRGLPVFRGLIGPIPEGKNVIRYESPEVFETLTKDWSSMKPARRRSRNPVPVPDAAPAAP